MHISHLELRWTTHYIHIQHIFAECNSPVTHMDMPSSSYHSTYRGSSRTTTTTSYTPSTALTSRAYPYPSPGSALNQSEDPVVIEIGTRYLRAGFANEPAPRCEILYTEDLWRRVGDKVVDSGKKGGTMLPQRTSAVLDTTAQSKKKSTRKSRGELWQHDLRSLDTGLVEDLLERALREAYNKYYLYIHAYNMGGAPDRIANIKFPMGK